MCYICKNGGFLYVNWSMAGVFGVLCFLLFTTGGSTEANAHLLGRGDGILAYYCDYVVPQVSPTLIIAVLNGYYITPTSQIAPIFDDLLNDILMYSYFGKCLPVHLFNI